MGRQKGISDKTKEIYRPWCPHDVLIKIVANVPRKNQELLMEMVNIMAEVQPNKIGDMDIVIKRMSDPKKVKTALYKRVIQNLRDDGFIEYWVDGGPRSRPKFKTLEKIPMYKYKREEGPASEKKKAEKKKKLRETTEDKLKVVMMDEIIGMNLSESLVDITHAVKFDGITYHLTVTKM